MTDAFALLGEPRHPWIDPDALKARFLTLSAPFHPDRCHQAPEAERQEANHRFAELSAAHNTLREPRERLLHLIQLEAGAPPRDVQRIPPGTMDLFVQIGQACREADGFLLQRSAAASPMLKLKQLQDSLEWTDRLGALQTEVNRRQAELVQELQTLNTVWDSAPPVGDPGRQQALPLGRLEELYRAMSYIGRWTEQLQDRFVRLAMS